MKEKFASNYLETTVIVEDFPTGIPMWVELKIAKTCLEKSVKQTPLEDTVDDVFAPFKLEENTCKIFAFESEPSC